MMSCGFSSLPVIFLIASSSRRLVVGHVDRTIDDGPLDTMPNMSPSWSSSFEIFLNSSRTRPVLWNCRCRSSTKKTKMRPETSLVRGRAGGRMSPSGGGGGGGSQHVGHAAAVTDRHRRDVLLHAVLVDLEFFILQIGDEIAFVVADDDVGRDEIDLDPEGRILRRRWRLVPGACADSAAVRTTRQSGGPEPASFSNS